MAAQPIGKTERIATAALAGVCLAGCLYLSSPDELATAPEAAFPTADRSTDSGGSLGPSGPADDTADATPEPVDPQTNRQSPITNHESPIANHDPPPPPAALPDDYGIDEFAAWQDPRPLLVVFTQGIGCAACVKLEAWLASPEFQELAGLDRFAVVRIYCPSPRQATYRAPNIVPRLRIVPADRQSLGPLYALPDRPETLAAALRAWADTP